MVVTSAVLVHNMSACFSEDGHLLDSQIFGRHSLKGKFFSLEQSLVSTQVTRRKSGYWYTNINVCQKRIIDMPAAQYTVEQK